MIVHRIAEDNLPVGIIKSFPRAFIVQEILKDGSVVTLRSKTKIRGFRGRSPHTLFVMTKCGMTTYDARREVARQFNVSMDCISVQGRKDKHAYTSQLISVKGKFHPRFQHDDIVLVQMGEANKPLRPGGNAGNRFCIQVETIATDIDESQLKSFRNYFGTQRFGRYPNPHIGRLIFEGSFEEAVRALLKDVFVGKGIRRALKQHNGSFEKALFDNSIKYGIAFRIQQWQSHMWNELLSQIDSPPELLPFWDTRPEVRDLYSHIWNPEFVDERAIEYSNKFWRPTIVSPRNIKVTKKFVGWEFRFDLPSGAYATVALSNLFQLRENR